MRSTSAFPVRPTPPLLVVEDSNEDFEALQRFLQRSALLQRGDAKGERSSASLSPVTIPIHRCVNGEQALAFLYRTGNYSDRKVPRPGLIVLDLNLPGTDGREVLRRIKQEANLKTIPVVVFTTSNNPKDIEECYRYGVNSYIVKPIDFAQLKRDIQTLVDYWFEVTMLPDCWED